MNSSSDRKRRKPLRESIVLFGVKLLIRAALLVGAWQFRYAAGNKPRRMLAAVCLKAIYALAYLLGAVVRGIALERICPVVYAAAREVDA